MSVDSTTRSPDAARQSPPQSANAVSGRVHVSDTVVAKIAAQAATELSDVGAAARRVLGRTMVGAGRLGIRGSDLDHLPKTSADVDGQRAFVDMTIAVRWPASVAAVTSSLREHVRDRVEHLTGLSVADVRITVADLITEHPTGRRVQ